MTTPAPAFDRGWLWSMHAAFRSSAKWRGRRRSVATHRSCRSSHDLPVSAPNAPTGADGCAPRVLELHDRAGSPAEAPVDSAASESRPLHRLVGWSWGVLETPGDPPAPSMVHLALGVSLRGVATDHPSPERDGP